MRLYSILLLTALVATGCSTAIKHDCGLPTGPECASVQDAYRISLADIDGQSSGNTMHYGYQPTAQPTEVVHVKKVRKPLPGKKDKYKIETKVEAYLDKTKPVPMPEGFGPNGVPLAPGNMNDESLYYATTPDPLPSGYVPPQFVRVWVPRWISSAGDSMHESYFDMILSPGHWATGVHVNDIRSIVRKKKNARSKGGYREGYVKYVAHFPWGTRTWERDREGNVTLTVYKNDTKQKAVQHFPHGTGAPFAMGEQVYPPVTQQSAQQKTSTPQATNQIPAQQQSAVAPQQPQVNQPVGAAAINQQTGVNPPVAPMQ